ncbi:MAG: Gldg family protein [bacterium]
MIQALKPIFTIAKKEFKAYFDHPIAYVILVVFLVANSFFYFRSVFLYDIADLRSMFDMFTWLFLFIVPAITMRLLAEEKQNHTLQLLRSQPIKDWQVLVGKYFGSLSFLVTGILLTLLIPFFLSFYGDFDAGTITAQYIAAILLAGLASAIGMFASSLTKNQVVAFITAVGITFIFAIIGFEVVLSSVSGLIQQIFEQLSYSWHYNNMIRGVIDLRDLVYFLTAIAAFLLSTYWFMVRESINPKRKVWRQLKIGLIALIAIAIVINLLGLNIRGRLDLTNQNLYTLSDASKTIVKELPDIVTIDVYQSKEFPQELSVLARDIKDLLTDYEIESGGKLKVNYKEVNSENEVDAQSAGIQQIQYNVIKQDAYQVQNGYFGLSISYLDDTEVIPILEKSDDFEYRLSSLIRKLTVDTSATIGFLSGHEEKSIYADYSGFYQELDKQYDVVDVTYDTENSVLSESPDVLVIAGPTGEVSEEEVTALKKYIDEGGETMFLLDGITMGTQSINATVNDNAINKIVSDYGVDLKNNIVGDLKSHESVSFSGGGFNYVIPYPFWPRTIPSTDSAITSALTTVVMPWPSSLEVKEGTEATNLLSTTDSGFAQTGSFNLDPNSELKINQEELSEYKLVVTVTGEGEKGRMIVMGDSDFLTDNYVQSNPQVLILALNSIDWLTQNDALAQIRVKQGYAAPLIFESQTQQNQVKYINLVIIPLGVALFGFYYLARRRKKTKRNLENHES